jgi:hypothetical protein
MRRLSFSGYLESYVRYLSGGDALALRPLAELTQSEPRLVEPLLLWVAKTGRDQRLQRLLADRDDLTRELKTLVSLEQRDQLESALSTEGPELRAEYSKVWRSYLARSNAPARDAELKLAARSRALALERTKGVSRYRMAKDLGLNPGNLHAFLAQGNASKLSLERAFELVSYLEAA